MERENSVNLKEVMPKSRRHEPSTAHGNHFLPLDGSISNDLPVAELMLALAVTSSFSHRIFANTEVKNTLMEHENLNLRVMESVSVEESRIIS